MTLVGKTEYTISIRITHSCMAGFLFHANNKRNPSAYSRFFVLQEKFEARKEVLSAMGQGGNVRVGEKKGSIFSLHPWLPRKKKSKVKNQRQHCFKSI